MRAKNFNALLYSLLITLGAGVVGSLFTIGSIPTWYASLNKPSFNPPNFVFGPVWTFLYFLMGISLYLVLLKKPKEKNAVNIYWIQLMLNILWSVIFFYFKSPLFAFLEIIVLWIFIFLTIRSFYKISRSASYLLIPYILWVTFATILNLSIILLNPWSISFILQPFLSQFTLEQNLW